MKLVTRMSIIAITFFMLLMGGCGRNPSWHQGTWAIDAEQTMKDMQSDDLDAEGKKLVENLAQAMEMAMEIEITKDEILRGAPGVGDKFKLRESYRIVKKDKDWIDIEIEKAFRVSGEKENTKTTARITKEGDKIVFEERATVDEGTIKMYLKRK